MAKELAYRVWVNDGGKQVLWAEKDHNGNKTNHLTKEQEQRYISGICSRISQGMTDYVNNHPDSALLNQAKERKCKPMGSFTIAVIILAFVLLVLGVIGCLNKAHTDNTKWLQNSWNEVMNEQRHLLEMIRENQNQIARLLRKLESEDERKD